MLSAWCSVKPHCVAPALTPGAVGAGGRAARDDGSLLVALREPDGGSPLEPGASHDFFQSCAARKASCRVHRGEFMVNGDIVRVAVKLVDPVRGDSHRLSLRIEVVVSLPPPYIVPPP